MRSRVRLFSVVTVFLSLLATIALAGTASAGQRQQSAPSKISNSSATPTDAVSGQAGTPTIQAACPFEDFCAYSGRNFSGGQKNMFACQDYPIPYVGLGSWNNNQTRGTVALFLDANKRVIGRTPPAPSFSLSFNWTPVFFVKNC